jgi:hypothetical protein
MDIGQNLKDRKVKFVYIIIPSLKALFHRSLAAPLKKKCMASSFTLIDSSIDVLAKLAVGV